MREANPAAEPIGQHLIQLISNLCFSVFVFAVLIFTVIAITYQPPDPWLESAPALTKLFSQSENATFQIDSSIIKTGEDTEAPITISPLITEETIQTSESRLTGDKDTPSSGCDNSQITNCSDPIILFTVEKFNLKWFKSIVFLDYQPPVNGSNPNECDVAWRFRNKREKSWRKYRDFRRFTFDISENCSYVVLHAGGWHSGVNARRQRTKPNSTRPISKPPKIAAPLADEEINDTLPTLGSESKFRQGKYLYYTKGGEHCKGMNHYLWSFLCGLGEAKYLNRTFVLDLKICLSGSYNPSGKDEEGKDFRFYFDFEHLKENSSIVEESEFLKDWAKWDESHKKKVPVKKVDSYKVTPMSLSNEKSTIVMRNFDGAEPESYWYRVCEGETAKLIERPWQAVWKSKHLMNIVTEISGRMDWDFDSVHVVRGEKAQNKEMWPHLDADTSPEALVAKLKEAVQAGRDLYIATNEPYYNYFDKLRSVYKVHLLEDYKELWGNTSNWFNETMLITNGTAVDFDGYMRAAVDTEVFYRSKTRVDTFYNLTADCKDGPNTC